jgi:hypothetical protein
MFINIAQTIETDNEWNQVRSKYVEATSLSPARIQIAFGYVNSLLLNIDEAKRLFLELEIALREAYDEEAANV